MFHITNRIPTQEEANMHIDAARWDRRQAYKEHLIDQYIKATPEASAKDINDKAHTLAMLVYPDYQRTEQPG